MLTPAASQTKKGLSIHTWPAGHATDIEETIKFSELQDIDCMVETFPLDKANEAYGEWLRITGPMLCSLLRIADLCRPCRLRAEAMLHGKVRFRAVITFD
jgi:hypothetical protein